MSPRFQRRPNIARLARRGKVEKLIGALSYRDVLTTRRRQFDLGAPVRAEAARALGEIGDPSAIRPLTEVVMADRDPRVRTLAVLALDGSTDLDVLTALVNGVCTWHEPVYQAARDTAVAHIRHIPVGVAPELARALIGRTHSRGLDEDEKWVVREVIAPDEQKRQTCASMLVRWLGSDDDAIAQRAADAIVELAPCGTNVLLEALSESSLSARAAEVVARRRDRQALEPLTHLLRADSPATRKAAAAALGELRDPLAAEALIAASNDADGEVRMAAAEAIDKLGAFAVIASVSNMIGTPVDERQRFVRESGQWSSEDNSRLGAGFRFREIERRQTDRGVQLPPPAISAPPLQEAEDTGPDGREEGEADLRGVSSGHPGAAVTRADVGGTAVHARAGILIALRRRLGLLALIAAFAAAVLGFIVARASGGHGVAIARREPKA